MYRVLLDDADAATHHFKQWQAKLYVAEMAGTQFQEYSIANELRHEAERAHDKAIDILLKRYGVNRYEFIGIDKYAREAARQEHNLRAMILSDVWRYLDRNKPEEKALEIFMGPELYALRRASQSGQR